MAMCASRRCGREAAEDHERCLRCQYLWAIAGSPRGSWQPSEDQLQEPDPADDVIGYLMGDPGARAAYRKRIEETPPPAHGRTRRPKKSRIDPQLENEDDNSATARPRKAQQR